MLSLRIEIPMLPPRVLSPNARPSPWEKRASKREYAEAVRLCAISARNQWEGERGLRWPLLKRAKARATLVYAEDRGRDEDNVGAMLKCAWDSLVEAELVIDDQAKVLSIEKPVLIVDKERAPLTVLEIEEVK